MAETPNTHRAEWITLGLLLTIALVLCLWVLRPFASPLLAGTLVAVLFCPLYAVILHRMPRYPSIAAFLTTLAVFFIFVLPFGIAISLAVQQLRALLESLGADGISDGASRLWAALEGPLNTMGGWFGTNATEMRQMLSARLRELGAAGGSFLLAMVGGATDGVIKGTVALLTMFFALRDGRAFAESVIARSPLGVERTRRILTAAGDTVVASFYGVIAVAAAQGALVWIGAWIAGLPSPVLWGLGACVASVIPIFGSALAWLPAAIVLFAQGSIGMGIFMLIWGAVLVANADNVVRPLVLMARVPANPLVVFITVLGGVQAFGLLGILLGPVVLGVTLTLIDIVREEVDHGRIVS